MIHMPSGGTIDRDGRNWISTRFDDPYVRDLKAQLAATGRQLWVLDITSDLGIPSFVALSHAVQDGYDFVEYGSGAHFDPRIALLRAPTEVNQFLSIGLMGARTPGQSRQDGATPFYLRDHPYLTPNGDAPVQSENNFNFGRLDKREQVMTCVNLAKRHGLDFLVLDQTRPDIEVPVVRVIVRDCAISIAASPRAGFTMSLSSSDCATGRYRRTSSIRFTRKPELRGRRPCSLLERKMADGLRRPRFRLASLPTSPSKESQTARLLLIFMAIRSP